MTSNSKLILVISIIYIIFFFSLSSGLINAILEGENLPDNLTFIPSRSFQTMSETIILVIILSVGTIGTFLLYQSGKVLTLKAQYGFIIGGFCAIALSLALGFMVINIKI
ncbi:MAG: hypothetical protein ACPKQO_08805 [Nitrososphaeraceae archaeon]